VFLTGNRKKEPNTSKESRLETNEGNKTKEKQLPTELLL
jgi:hypothetical protein